MSKQPNVDEILDLFSEKYSPEFFTSERSPIISLVDKGHKKTFDISSREFKLFFKDSMRTEGLRFSSNRLQECIEDLEAKSVRSDLKREAFIRTAYKDGLVAIDLCNDRYECIEINQEGWRVTNETAFDFLRLDKQRPLPIPQSVLIPTFLERFKFYLNIKGQFDWLLALAFILRSLIRDGGSYVLMVIEGPQGSGKTTFSKFLKSLIDPTRPMLFSPPKGSEDVLILGKSSWLIGIDNLSGINGDLSDTFCRVSTGGGMSKRSLYTNHDEVVYDIQRPCLFNGIDEPTTRPDFADRSIFLELNPFKPGERMGEIALEKKMVEDFPVIFGGICTLISQVLKILPNIPDKDLPRMTGFAQIGIALERAIGLPEGTFLKIYGQNIQDHIESQFADDELCNLIRIALNKEIENGKSRREACLEGTAVDLRQTIYKRHSINRSVPVTPPKNASAFSRYLKRMEPVLIRNGIVVERPTRTAQARIIKIRFASPELDVSQIL